MVTATTYTSWNVGDTISICAAINEFCGTTNKFIFANDINIVKSPTVCGLQFGIEGGCGLHLNNVELAFKTVMTTGSVQQKTCLPQQVFKTLGKATTNINGVASITYTVTAQDSLDAISTGYPGYKVMACITNPDGQLTDSGSLSVTSSNIIIGTLPLTATHYIEYDISMLPADLLNFISTGILDMSVFLGTYLPFPSNMQYVKSTYSAGKFQIYVRYTPSMSLYSMGEPVYNYNELTGEIEILFTMPTSLDLMAGFIASILTFAFFAGYLKTIAFPWGLVASGVIAIVGAVLVGWTIHDIATGLNIFGTPKIDTAGKQKNTGDFANQTRATIDTLYPGCKTGNCTNETVTKDLQKAYNKAMGAVNIAEYTSDETSKNTLDQAKVDAMTNKVLATDTCLSSGYCTTKQAADQTAAVTDTVTTNNVATVKDLCAKESGFKYNDKTGACDKVCNVEMFGACLDTPIMVGGLLLGGYIIYRIVK